MMRMAGVLTIHTGALFYVVAMAPSSAKYCVALANFAVGEPYIAPKGGCLRASCIYAGNHDGTSSWGSSLAQPPPDDCQHGAHGHFTASHTRLSRSTQHFARRKFEKKSKDTGVTYRTSASNRAFHLTTARRTEGSQSLAPSGTVPAASLALCLALSRIMAPAMRRLRRKEVKKSKLFHSPDLTARNFYRSGIDSEANAESVTITHHIALT
eukprot:scaffold28546_cov33-Prasinocladus_malaysianus.AAC.1